MLNQFHFKYEIFQQKQNANQKSVNKHQYNQHFEGKRNQSLFEDSTDSVEEQFQGQQLTGKQLLGLVEKYFSCRLCQRFFSQNQMSSLTGCEHLVCSSCREKQLKKAKGSIIRCHCGSFLNPKVSQIKAKNEDKKELKKVQCRMDHQQCKICCQFYDKTTLVSIYECDHKSCQNCCLDVVKDCIDNSKQIKCPFGCGSGYKVGSNFIVKLDEKYQAKYKNLEFIWFTQKQGLKRCPDEKCNQGILIEYDNFYECSSCYKRYCIKCRWRQHLGGCNNAVDNYIQNYLLFAECFKCKYRIQKNNGCNHMQCRCGYNFCYECLGKWSSDHVCPINNKRKFTMQVKNENQNDKMTESILEQQVNKRAKILGVKLEDAKLFNDGKVKGIFNWWDNGNEIQLVNRQASIFADENDREERRRKYEEGLQKQIEKMNQKQQALGFNGNLQMRPQFFRNYVLNQSIKHKCTRDHVKDIFDWGEKKTIAQKKYEPIVEERMPQNIRGQFNSVANNKKKYQKPKSHLAHLVSSIKF